MLVAQSLVTIPSPVAPNLVLSPGDVEKKKKGRHGKSRTVKLLKTRRHAENLPGAFDNKQIDFSFFSLFSSFFLIVQQLRREPRIC